MHPCCSQVILESVWGQLFRKYDLGYFLVYALDVPKLLSFQKKTPPHVKKKLNMKNVDNVK